MEYFSWAEEDKKLSETNNPPPPPNRVAYQFCPNTTNPWHECTEYCMAKYWPGNGPYVLSFCRNAQVERNHRCGLQCAVSHGPQAALDEKLFPNVQDPNKRYLIYCLMHYGRPKQQ